MKFEITCKNLVNRAAAAVFPRVCPVCGDILVEEDLAWVRCIRTNFANFEKEPVGAGADIHTDHIGKGILQVETEVEKRGRNDDCLVVNPYICRYCYERLKFICEPKCFKCGRMLNSDEEEFCYKCAAVSHEYEHGMSLLVHDDSARKMLYDLKYSNLRDNADFLALETALRLGRKIIFLEPDAIIPVPLHKKRKRDRGFNQAEILAEKILKDIEILSGVRLHYDNQIIVRHHNTKPQKELKEEKRKINVKNSFSLTDGCPYKRVILVDDIYTTGSTIDECARILKNGGVREVYFLTISIV